MDYDYKVKKGDNLYDICQRYYGNGDIFPKLADHNKINKDQTLVVDQVLKLPDTIWAADTVGNKGNKNPLKRYDRNIILGFLRTLFAPRSETRLQQILREYQVDDDTVEQWKPSIWGVIPIPFTDSYGRRLTSTEGKLLDNLSRDRGLIGLKTFRDIADQAFADSEAQYPHSGPVPSYVPTARHREWIGNDGHRDAFRHAYWNALLTREFGYKWTLQFTTAHEALPGNPCTREAMDLFNNEVGRNIARANPKVSDTEIINLVRKAVTDGDLVVVDQLGDLAWSNTIPLWQHGLSNTSNTLPGAIPVPDGSASA